MDHATILCTATVEELMTDCQSVRKQIIYKDARLSAVRDDLDQIILRVSSALTKGKKQRSVGYPVIQLVYFKSFLKEGKATIKLPAHSVQVLISNAPPDSLRLFLGTLRTKWKIASSKGRILSERNKFRKETGPASSVSLLEEMSPLCRTDMLQLDQNKVKQFFIKTPTRPPKSIIAKGLNDDRKRKFENVNIESISPISKNGASSTPDCKQMTSTPVRQKRSRFSSDGLANIPAISSPTACRKPSSQLYSGLTDSQIKVLRTVRSGQNVFYTGSAGTGKSFLIKKIIGLLPPSQTMVTASTGVAACQIGGRTVHNFAGIGSGQAPLQQCVTLALRPKVSRVWRQCRHLIIDEISLIDADLFTKLDHVAREVRGEKKKPFGGIQLILCGDFLQLPPVKKFDGTSKDKKSGINFAFKSPSWQEAIHCVVELKQVMRQSDQQFISLLQRIRLGQCTEQDCRRLQATANNRFDYNGSGIVATQLSTHKEHVLSVNRNELAKLPGDAKFFPANDSETAYSSMVDNICPAPSALTLKENAQVMLVKNLDVTQGLANGARGVVVKFLPSNEGGYPVVRFLNNVEKVINPDRWSVDLGEGRIVTRRQLPLALAWAISIHKSQGMTLEWVELHLSKVFECGQAYVALSRCRNLESMRIMDWKMSCARADPDVLTYYQSIDNEDHIDYENENLFDRF